MVVRRMVTDLALDRRRWLCAGLKPEGKGTKRTCNLARATPSTVGQPRPTTAWARRELAMPTTYMPRAQRQRGGRPTCLERKVVRGARLDHVEVRDAENLARLLHDGVGLVAAVHGHIGAVAPRRTRRRDQHDDGRFPCRALDHGAAAACVVTRRVVTRCHDCISARLDATQPCACCARGRGSRCAQAAPSQTRVPAWAQCWFGAREHGTVSRWITGSGTRHGLCQRHGIHGSAWLGW